MYTISLKNCNNINSGSLSIYKNRLNIKYGINGTGKTTIAKAIQAHLDSPSLEKLTSYSSETPASVNISETINNILVFNEDFVNQFVFQKDEVISNSFEVFLKTPNYEMQKELLNHHLLQLKEFVIYNDKIINFKDNLFKFSSKFKLTTSGGIAHAGVYKSLTSKQNLYNIPSELSSYNKFFNNPDINISWIDWRNKGDDYDIGDNCPYCSEKLNRQIHDKKKNIFRKNYKKSDSKNLKEILDLLSHLKDYIKPDEYNKFITYIKEDTPSENIEKILSDFLSDSNLILSKFQAIDEFGNKNLLITDISNIERIISQMEIPIDIFKVLGSQLFIDISSDINKNIDSLKKEASILKQEMGKLKGLLQSTIKESQIDINSFLQTAGINYEVSIQSEDENQSKTILKQCFTKEKTFVTDIKEHLSWGEKNAFSLILFMYYACSQDPDLIILDDPISSFDSNKKFAILHRMFKKTNKRKISFINRTVLLLTHDFEPITDFLIVGKLSSNQVSASFIWNNFGLLCEKNISTKTDIKIIYSECETIASNPKINIISRIAFLRKLAELNITKDSWKFVYEILSSLIHGKKNISIKKGHDNYVPIESKNLNLGIQNIKKYIPDFDYKKIQSTIYTIPNLKKLYEHEENSYFKIQIFRAMCEIAKDISISPDDEGWYKFIDETYHIENDYLHYLDITKFNIVPNYILSKVNALIQTI